MKTDVLLLVKDYGPISTANLHQLLENIYGEETMDQRELFDLLNTEANKHNLVRTTGSNLGEGLYDGTLCFYWSKSE